MKLRTKLIITILLIFILVPFVETRHSQYEVWQFGNFHYLEHKYTTHEILEHNKPNNQWKCISSDKFPSISQLPKYKYSYLSFFIGIIYEKDYCDLYSSHPKNIFYITFLPKNPIHHSFIYFGISNSGIGFHIRYTNIINHGWSTYIDNINVNGWTPHYP